MFNKLKKGINKFLKDQKQLLKYFFFIFLYKSEKGIAPIVGAALISGGASLLGSLLSGQRKQTESQPTIDPWARRQIQGVVSPYYRGLMPYAQGLTSQSMGLLSSQMAGGEPEPWRKSWEWIQQMYGNLNKPIGRGGGGMRPAGPATNWLDYYKSLRQPWEADIQTARQGITPFTSVEGWMRDISPILEDTEAQIREQMRMQGLPFSTTESGTLTRELAKLRLGELGRAQEGVLKASSMLPSLMSPLGGYLGGLAGIEQRDIASRRASAAAAAARRMQTQLALISAAQRQGGLYPKLALSQAGLGYRMGSGIPAQYGGLLTSMQTRPATYQPTAGESILGGLMSTIPSVIGAYGMGKELGWWGGNTGYNPTFSAYGGVGYGG